MKNIVIFGTSWSDACYSTNTPIRHKTWSEYLKDYNDNICIYNYAVSGSSLEFQLFRLSSLFSNQNQFKKIDAVLFEIPPLTRHWEPAEYLEWVPSGAFGDNTYFKSGLGDEYADDKLQRYRESSQTAIRSYFLSGHSGIKMQQEHIPEGLPDPIDGWEDDKIEKYFKDRAIHQNDWITYRNALLVASLKSIERILETKILTFSFPLMSPFKYNNQILKGETHDWEWVKNCTETKTDFKKTITEGLYPSNIGLDSVLDIYIRQFPDRYDREWWKDEAHPSGKGNEWICKNIFMKNKEIRKLILE